MNEDGDYGIGDGFWNTGIYGDGFPDAGVVTLDPFNVSVGPDTTPFDTNDDWFYNNIVDYFGPDNNFTDAWTLDWGFVPGVEPSVPSPVRPTTPTPPTAPRPPTSTPPVTPRPGTSSGGGSSGSSSNSSLNAINKALTDLGRLTQSILSQLQPRQTPAVTPGTGTAPVQSLDGVAVLAVGVLAAIVLFR